MHNIGRVVRDKAHWCFVHQLIWKGFMKKAIGRFLGVGVAALGVAAFINSADGNSIYAPNPPSITPVGSNFRWDYDIVVSQGSQVDSGDGFTIYDFGGFVGVSGSLPA